MDEFDRKILNALQRNSAANRAQLARMSDIGIPHKAEFTVLNDGGIYLTRAVSDPGSEWSAVPR